MGDSAFSDLILESLVFHFGNFPQKARVVYVQNLALLVIKKHVLGSQLQVIVLSFQTYNCLDRIFKLKSFEYLVQGLKVLLRFDKVQVVVHSLIVINFEYFCLEKLGIIFTQASKVYEGRIAQLYGL